MSSNSNRSTMSVVQEMKLALKKDMAVAVFSGMILFIAFMYYKPVSTLYEMSGREGSYIDVMAGFLFSFFIVVSYFSLKRLVEMKRFFKEAMAMSRMDFLTEVYNRRALFEMLELEFNKNKRFPDAKFCFLLFDIDNFKGINDGYGHATGDTVLREVAKTVVCSVRKTDVCGRFGGDEFGVILPYTELSKGIIVADKIKENVSKLIFGPLRERFSVTLSMGVVVVPAGSGVETMEQLVEHVDKYLYTAKRSGRNRVASPLDEIAKGA